MLHLSLPPLLPPLFPSPLYFPFPPSLLSSPLLPPLLPPPFTHLFQEVSIDQSLAPDSLPVPLHQGAEAEANVRRRRATYSILYRDGQRHPPIVRRRDPDEREEEPAEGEESELCVIFCPSCTITRLNGRSL